MQMYPSVLLQHTPGFPGVQIGTHINDWNLDADELQPIFAVSKFCQIFNNLRINGNNSKYCQKCNTSSDRKKM